MVVLWFSHGFPMVFLWFSSGFTSDTMANYRSVEVLHRRLLRWLNVANGCIDPGGPSDLEHLRTLFEDG